MSRVSLKELCFVDIERHFGGFLKTFEEATNLARRFRAL